MCKMADRGQITGGVLDGPLAFDNAIDPEAARIKGIKSRGCGPRADSGRAQSRSRQHVGKKPDLLVESGCRGARTRSAGAGHPHLASGFGAYPHGLLRHRLAVRRCAASLNRTSGGVTIMDTILVVNAGSSSVKFRVFETGSGRPLKQLVSGQIDGIGVRPKLSATGAAGETLIDRGYDAKAMPDVVTAMRTAGAWLQSEQNLHFVAVGHRVVHGGPQYDRPTLVNQKVFDDLERYIPLAPLHQPNNLAPIRILLERFPGMPQVACFDTAFHRGHSRRRGPLRYSGASLCGRRAALRLSRLVL